MEWVLTMTKTITITKTITLTLTKTITKTENLNVNHLCLLPYHLSLVTYNFENLKLITKHLPLNF